MFNKCNGPEESTTKQADLELLPPLTSARRYSKEQLIGRQTNLLTTRLGGLLKQDLIGHRAGRRPTRTEANRHLP